MAVNVYVSPNILGNVVKQSLRALQGQGTGDGLLYAVAQIGASDGNGSIYRLFKNLNRDLTILSLTYGNTAMTGGTSYGLGLYAADLSTTLYTTASYFSGVLNLTTANLFPSANALAGLSVATTGANGFVGGVFLNRIFEHAGFSNASTPQPPDAYDLCLTATTAATVAGTFVCILNYAMD